jgi:phosphoglycolate phosphatase-like HAD superfamily hydrolase
LDDTEEFTKENIIRRILDEELSGHGEDVMVVAGDGPVEVRAAKDYGAVALGVASDEAAGCGWNEKKADRLAKAGADILIPDFSEAEPLVALIEGG